MNRLLCILLAKELIVTLVQLVFKNCSLLKAVCCKIDLFFFFHLRISSVEKTKVARKCPFLKDPGLYRFPHKLVDALVSVGP